MKKVAPSGTSLFVYDLQGHLIGEYQADGKPLQKTVWLGDLPVAVISPSAAGSSINYIWADHLGTPRQISDPANGKIIWRWMVLIKVIFN
ncbi:hypothetical protein R6242_00425 [Iodobacter sp. CM08]|uniref:hypothetical protein n=1 Tax=Iodobacter sp. CM08 TaxID=3085902 RepID=UPI0029829233|nr:hypothetical protein [Iodobacter sp. CM08]MDW5415038.1 hypothetical protein [Iodobacter sp. CM08]